MDDIVKEAAIGFKINLRNYSKIRAVFLLDTDKGAVVLKKQGDIRKIESIYETSLKLHKAGFENAETYLTVNGKPYISIRDSVYTATTCGTGSKCCFTDKDGVSSIARTIALLHKTGANADIAWLSASKTSVSTYYTKKITEARHIKKWLNRKGHLTDIDVLFIKKYSEYLNRAETSTENICAFLKGKQLSLCFDAIKEDNIYIDDIGRVTLINLENCVLSTPLSDLCQLIRRCVKRGGDAGLVSDIISSYTAENALTENDLSFVRAFLTFPHKYFTLVNRYYNGKKHYDTTHTYAKLKAETVHQDRIFEILNMI